MSATPNVGWWWRFSAYEILDNYIRPASDARLERYDPWRNYAAAAEGDRPGAAGKRSMLTPYAELFELLGRAQSPTDLVNANPKLQEDIAAWCSQHGLLGILPQRAQNVRLAARWQIDSPYSPEPGRQLVPTVREFIRRSDGWEQRDTILDNARGESAYHVLDEHPEIQGRLVRSEDLRPGDSEGYADLLEHLGSFNYRRESLDWSWGRYFPSVPPEFVPTFQFPHPLSDEFWHEYAEPVDDFLRAAALLLDTVRALALVKEIQERELTARETLDWQRAHYSLNALVDPVRPSFWMPDPPDGTITELWACPSLLASFSKMAGQDLSTGRVFVCEACGKIAVSAAWQAGYCSPKCKNTAAKRRQRARKKGKRHGKTKG